ncbi:MAG: hypothetical protein Fur002_24690 [Anaerolineales bacterium]
MEKLLNDQVTGQVKQAFAELVHPVQLLFFGSKENCEYCAETQALLSEISAVDERVLLSIHDIQADAALAAQFRVDKFPTIVVAAVKDGQPVDVGVQFCGIPAGYEFSTLINDIIFASKQTTSLGDKAREFLQSLTQPLLLQVFVTPT